MVFCKTPFPGYSRGGALRAKIKLIQCKPAGIPLEQVVFCLIALRADPERLADIQREHLHEVFAVYRMLMVGNIDREAAAGGNADKVFHILRRSELNSEFHKTLPPELYKIAFFVYNGER